MITSPRYATKEDCDWLSFYLTTQSEHKDLIKSRRAREIISNIEHKYRDAARSLLIRHRFSVRLVASFDLINLTRHATTAAAVGIKPPSDTKREYLFLFDGDKKINKFTENEDVATLSILLGEGWKILSFHAMWEQGLRQDTEMISRFVEGKVHELVHRRISTEDCEWLSKTHTFKSKEHLRQLPDGFASRVDGLVDEAHKRAAILILSQPYVESILRSYWISRTRSSKDELYVQGLLLKPPYTPCRYMLFPFSTSSNEYDPYGLTSSFDEPKDHILPLCLSLLLYEGWQVIADSSVNPGDTTDGRICYCQ